MIAAISTIQATLPTDVGSEKMATHVFRTPNRPKDIKNLKIFKTRKNGAHDMAGPRATNPYYLLEHSKA